MAVTIGAVAAMAVAIAPTASAAPTDPAPVPGTATASPNAKAAPSALAALAANGLNPFATVTGKVYMSQDATGTNDPLGATVVVQKSGPSATVAAAYLLAAGTPGTILANGDITLGGIPISFDPSHSATGVLSINSIWTDVTSIVKPVVDAAPVGVVPFTVAEPTRTASIDGEILAVIMNDPTLPTDNTVSFQFGALASAGDTYAIGLASPLNLSDPNLALTMSIGDSFGFQGPPAVAQFSTIAVNGTLMTSSAGGNDDSICKNNNPQNFGNTAVCGNGALISVGGVGDSTANPPDPTATPSTCGVPGPPRCDDELYNLLPFVKDGDTSITVNTSNPSNDDNIFFTGFQLNSTAAVVGLGAVLTPVSGTSPMNTQYTFTTKVQDANGVPIANQAVTFTVVSGPNAGRTGPATTGADGTATFTYAGSAAGTDTVQVSFSDTNGNTVVSNEATVTWEAAANNPPTATDQSVITAQDTPVAITLAGADADNDPLTFAVTAGPAHGTLSGTAPNVTYTPAAGYFGPDSFTFTTNDGKAPSAAGTVSITVTPVSAGCPTAAALLDKFVAADVRRPTTKFIAPKLTTAGGGELILAFVEADGPTAPTQTVKGVSGGGLTWTLAARSNKTWGTTEVWQAYATKALSGAAVTATLAKAFDGTITVAAFKGAARKVGATGTGSGLKGTPTAIVTPKSCGSLIWAAGHDWTQATTPVAPAGQTLEHTFIDKVVNDSFWTQSVDAPTADTTPVTVTTNGPSKDRWTLAAVEIPAAG
jgi:hypothetical protein